MSHKPRAPLIGAIAWDQVFASALSSACALAPILPIEAEVGHVVDQLEVPLPTFPRR